MGFVHKYYFFGVRAEILLSRVIATRDSCAGPFFRDCSEIFTSESILPPLTETYILDLPYMHQFN